MTPIKGLYNCDSCWQTTSSCGVELQPMIQEGEGEIISCGLKKASIICICKSGVWSPCGLTCLFWSNSFLSVIFKLSQFLWVVCSPRTWRWGAVSDSSEVLWSWRELVKGPEELTVGNTSASCTQFQPLDSPTGTLGGLGTGTWEK